MSSSPAAQASTHAVGSSPLLVKQRGIYRVPYRSATAPGHPRIHLAACYPSLVDISRCLPTTLQRRTPRFSTIHTHIYIVILLCCSTHLRCVSHCNFKTLFVIYTIVFGAKIFFWHKHKTAPVVPCNNMHVSSSVGVRFTALMQSGDGKRLQMVGGYGGVTLHTHTHTHTNKHIPNTEPLTVFCTQSVNTALRNFISRIFSSFYRETAYSYRDVLFFFKKWKVSRIAIQQWKFENMYQNI